MADSSPSVNNLKYPAEGPAIGEHSQGIKSSSSRLADRTMALAVKLIDQCDRVKSKRLAAIREMERAYFNDVRPNLKGRSNIPFPLLPKYVDELKAGMDEFPKLTVGPGMRIAQLRLAKKMEALTDKYKRPVRGDWARKARMLSTRMIFTGVGVINKYSERVDGKFCDYWRNIDLNDLIFESKGGNNPDDHLIFGEFPIFRTRNDMLRLAKGGVYKMEQVANLIRKYSGNDYKKNDQYFTNKYERYRSLGIDMEQNSYVGQPIISLFSVQIQAEDGKWYILTGDYTSQTWVRFDPMEKAFKSGYKPGKKSYVVAQTHEDADNLLCKAPVDDIYPLHEAGRVKLNQLIDLATKITWGQVGYDPNFVPDASQLEWNRPDQKIVMRAYQGKALGTGIYEFRTPGDGAKISMDLITLFDNSLAAITGVNPNSITNDDQRVGVVFGNLQKVGSRLGVANKSFKEMMDKVLERFVCGAWDNLGEKEVVKLIGTKGVEWDELTREELKGEPDFDYNAVGANVELAMSEARKKNQRETLDTLIKDPDMKKQLNPKMLAAELLEVGEFEEEKIKRLLDVAHYGSEDALSRADEACELIMRGKQPKIYPGADLAFFQYIYDFAVNLDEGEAKKKVELMAYGRAHLQLVVRNMAQKAMIQKTMQAGEAAAAGNAGGADAKGNPQQPPQQPPMTPLQQIQARIKAKTAKNFNLGNAPTGQQGVPAGVVGASAGGQSQTSILQGQ